MTKETNENLNINLANPETNIASSSQIKGKNKEIINVSKSLDLIIKDSENLKVDFTSESERDLVQTTGPHYCDNYLYRMKPKERQELAKEFTGLDRILYDRLLKKVGTKQIPTSMITFTSIFSFVPIAGGVVSSAVTTECDNYAIALEKSFSISEVKEIVAESQTEYLKTIQRAKNYLITMDNRREEELKEQETQKTKSEQKIAELEKKLKEAETRENKTAVLATEKLKEQKLFEENLQNEIQTQKKLLESKEKVAIRNLAEIQDQYNKLLRTTSDKDQKLTENHRTITELIALAEKLEQEKKITILERNKAITSRNAKDTENGILQGKINFLLDESKGLKRELSNQKKNHKAEIELKELQARNLLNENEDLAKMIESLDDEVKKIKNELEKLRLEYVAKCDEYNQLKNSLAPQSVRKLTHWID